MISRLKKACEYNTSDVTVLFTIAWYQGILMQIKTKFNEKEQVKDQEKDVNVLCCKYNQIYISRYIWGWRNE